MAAEAWTNCDLPSRHPLRRVNQALRMWLAMFALMMFWNAAAANPIILSGALRPIPFTVLGFVALCWLLFPWSGSVTIWSAALMSVGVLLRGAEIVAFGADTYEPRTRASAVSLWVLISGTALVFGFLNLVAISRRSADAQVWGTR